MRRKSDTWIKYYHREDRDLLFSDFYNDGDNRSSDFNRGSEARRIVSSSSIRQPMFVPPASVQSPTKLMSPTSSDACDELLAARRNQSLLVNNHSRHHHTQTKARTFVSSVCRLYSGNFAFLLFIFPVFFFSEATAWCVLLSIWKSFLCIINFLFHFENYFPKQIVGFPHVASGPNMNFLKKRIFNVYFRLG